MTPQTKNCESCKTDFTITPDDLTFYEKVCVPPQTWCADCCRQRRMAFRNERSLYKRKDSHTGKDIIATYSGDKPSKVYEAKYWWSDAWDPMEYGKYYDFSRPFFTQLHELIESVPWPALFNFNGVNSDYCNITTDNKNCYLVFGGDFNENCSYGGFNMNSKDSMDLYWVNKCELCYECVDCEGCYKVRFAQYARDCADSSFLYNCVGCQSCFGCVNLRSKSYCIFNKQYSKDEYENRLKELDPHTNEGIKRIKKQLEDLKLKQPHKYADIVKSENCSGNNIHNAKNCLNCFDVYENAENLKDVFLAGWTAKDAMNSNHFGHKAELIYESWTVFDNSNKVLFSGFVQGSHNVQYSYGIFGSSNMFGCAAMRSKEYCILNKKYSKEEFNELVPKIIKHMDEMPYKDKSGKTYKYGEHMPIELSPYAYNETIAQEYYPLSKSEAEAKGYKWKDKEEKGYEITKKPNDLPNNIKDVDDSILQEVIRCEHEGRCGEQCTEAFKIVPQELQFYKRMNLPLPRLCSNCRHYARLKQRNPLKLWHRKCQCAGNKSEARNSKSGTYEYENTANHSHHNTDPCPNSFETSYPPKADPPREGSPDRPEIIYCEQCYQQEVS